MEDMTMNLLEAAKRVDRSEWNKSCADFDELCTELNYQASQYNWDGFQAEVTEFWLHKRLVSFDTDVGVSVGVIGGEVVYIRTVTGRRSPVQYAFVSEVTAERVLQAIKRHCTDRLPVTLLNHAMDIDDFYSASHGEEIQVEKGFHNGVPVTHNLKAGWQSLNGRDIFVLIDETQEKITIPCTEFMMPLHLAPTEPL
jgi:hypothetical protein